MPEAEGMMVPYLLRLICLCLAAFFVIHSVAGALVAVGGGAAVRAARRMRARAAGRFLLGLRLAPAALGLLVVTGICIPSYLWLEPEVNAEEVGAGCLAAALLAAALWTASVVRAARAAAHSLRHARSCERLGRLSVLPGARLPVRILDSPAPLLAMVGVVHSRIVISSSVMSALNGGQLAAALRHEDAHGVSRDNLKRFLMLLAPPLLPGLYGFHAIERGWARFTEWAADDDAVTGDADRSLSLAAALVCVARMAGPVAAPPLTTSFLGDSREISARVDRLLGPMPGTPRSPRNSAATAAGLALAAGCAATLWHPAILQSAHRIIEQLIH